MALSAAELPMLVLSVSFASTVALSHRFSVLFIFLPIVRSLYLIPFISISYTYV